ncbi:MAG: hypothetical protein RLZZ450_4664, partial [Pseudomonadota bacterium]
MGIPMLQWGRDAQVSERTRVVGSSLTTCEGFNGAETLRSRKVYTSQLLQWLDVMASMGPRRSGLGKSSVRNGARVWFLDASMGPRRSGLGKIAARDSQVWVCKASMGPRRSGLGKIGYAGIKSFPLPASMGPRRSGLGKGKTMWSPLAPIPSFNGAETLRSRKAPRSVRLPAVGRVASMGPRRSGLGKARACAR